MGFAAQPLEAAVPGLTDLQSQKPLFRFTPMPRQPRTERLGRNPSANLLPLVPRPHLVFDKLRILCYSGNIVIQLAADNGFFAGKHAPHDIAFFPFTAD
jgi:hypothetical protein